MTERILFTHNDLDGIGASVVFKHIFGRNAETHHIPNHKVDEVVANRLKEIRNSNTWILPTIYLTDISVNEEVAKILHDYPGMVVLLDHHETAKWLEETYSWAVVDTKRSGTRLLYDYFIQEYGGMSMVSLYDFVTLVNDYDLWIHDFRDSKQLNRLFYLIGIEKFEERFVDNPSVKFTDAELMILDMDDKAYERYFNKVSRGFRRHNNPEFSVIGVGFVDRYHSEVGNDLLAEYSGDWNAVAMIDPNGCKVSLRSNGKTNVARIAKALGGGGHPQAAGFSIESYQCSTETVRNLIEQAYENIVMDDMTVSLWGDE